MPLLRNRVLTTFVFALVASCFIAGPARADHIAAEKGFGLMTLLLPTDGGALPDLANVRMPDDGEYMWYPDETSLSMLIVGSDPTGGFPFIRWTSEDWSADLTGTTIMPGTTNFRFVGGGFFPEVEGSHIYHGEPGQADAPIDPYVQQAFVNGLHEIQFGSSNPFGAPSGPGGFFGGTQTTDSLIRYFAGFYFEEEGLSPDQVYNQIATILFLDGGAYSIATVGTAFSVDTSEIIFPHIPLGPSGSLTLGFNIDSNGLPTTGNEFLRQSPVPEPGTIVLIGAAALGLAIARRRRRRNAA